MTSLVFKLAKHITWLLFSDWRQGVGSRTNKPSRLKKNPVEYNRTRQFCTKRIDTLFPETDFGFFCFVYWCDSVCLRSNKRDEKKCSGELCEIEEIKGDGLVNTVNLITLKNLKKRVFKFYWFCLEYYFLPNATSGNVN